MAFFDIKNVGSVVTPGLLKIGGDVVKESIFGATDQGLTGKVREDVPQDFPDHISFQNFAADVRTRGVARNNRFIVQFAALPRGFNEINEFSQSAQYMQDLVFLTRSCETAQFPGQQLQTQEARFQDHMEKMPYLKNYNELNMVFRCDNEMLEKKFFDTWFNLVANPLNGNIRYKKDYQVFMYIYQFNEEGRATYGQLLEGVFPYSVTDLDLTQTADNAYHRLSIQFAYNKIYTLGIDSPVYSNESNAGATGAKSLSTYDKVLNEVFKQGKNVVTTSVLKNVPIGNIPGLGSASDIIGGLL